MEKKIPQNSEQFQETFDALMFFQEMGMGDVSEFLALEDDAFDALREIFLEQFDLAMGNPNDKYSLALGLQASGISLDSFKETVESVIEEIHKNETLSQSKRDFLEIILQKMVNATQSAVALNSRIVNVAIELSDPNAKMPEYARDGDAGMDVFSLIDCDIMPGESMMVPLGIKVGLPRGYELQVRPKSGLSAKTHLRIANAPGTIDAMYRDEVKVIVENNEPKIKDIEYILDDNGKITLTSILHGSPIHIDKGQKIAQLVLSEVPTAAFYVIEDIKEVAGDRGGGFGHTGK